MTPQVRRKESVCLDEKEDPGGRVLTVTVVRSPNSRRNYGGRGSSGDRLVGGSGPWR